VAHLPALIAPPALSANHCRERARKLFAEAVAHEDPQERELLLRRGEHWMQRWLYWPPEA